MKTWHEVTAEGESLVLLHGGFASGSSWFAQTPVLAEAGYRVDLPERRGHGHTPDIEGPITYSVMADDTIAYLETAVETPAHLVGWSDGAVVGLLVALRRPELVNRLVLIGQYFNSSGKTDDALTDELLNLDGEVTGFLREMHAAESPDGAEHFRSSTRRWPSCSTPSRSSIWPISASCRRRCSCFRATGMR